MHCQLRYQTQVGNDAPIASAEQAFKIHAKNILNLQAWRKASYRCKHAKSLSSGDQQHAAIFGR